MKLTTPDLKTNMARMKTLVFTAVESGFDMSTVPHGGSAPVCAFLMDEWRKRPPFDIRMASVALLGNDAPDERDFFRYTPKQHADFMFKFEQAVTQEILRHDPRETVVLCNGVSDGPRFKFLADKGYSVFAIFHMNMVSFFTGVFLKNLIRPETTVALYRVVSHSWLKFILPDVLKLIFVKEEESVIYCKGVIVPSEGMRRQLLRMYPDAAAERIHVVPWGAETITFDERQTQGKVEALRRKYKIRDDEAVLITLSRVSPEKGHDRLLKALELWEASDEYPKSGVCVLICGVAGYTHAKPFEKKIIAAANRLKKTRVIFPGYVHGADKHAHFRLSDLYVFPSRYEAYGLTLMEAFAAGLPAVATFSDGTEQIMRSDFGELIPAVAEREVPRRLKDAIQRMLSDREKLRAMGQAAKKFADEQPFSKAADRIAEIMSRP
jgi:glycosyltransferase involved in cell wall biosynthesis